LRGYHQYRFRDENALILNAEYRWRMREFFQVVGFADGGRVFARPGEIGLAGMRGSVGAGGRLKFGPRFSLGLDMGWSPDGVRFWVRGSDTF
jgi:hemolysin activation/secretion protein